MEKQKGIIYNYRKDLYIKDRSLKMLRRLWFETICKYDILFTPLKGYCRYYNDVNIGTNLDLTFYIESNNPTIGDSIMNKHTYLKCSVFVPMSSRDGEADTIILDIEEELLSELSKTTD